MVRVDDCKDIKVSRRRLFEMMNAGMELIRSLPAEAITERQKRLIEIFQKNAEMLSERNRLQSMAQEMYGIYVRMKKEHGVCEAGNQAYHEYRKYKSELDKLMEEMRREDAEEQESYQRILDRLQ